MPRKTTFVTFSVLGIVYQTITLTAGDFPAERRGSVRISLSVLCFHSVDHHCVEWPLWPSFRLKFGHTRILFFSPSAKANLESLCLFRCVAYTAVTSGLYDRRCGCVHPSGWPRLSSSRQPVSGGSAAFEGLPWSSLSSDSSSVGSAPAAAGEGEKCVFSCLLVLALEFWMKISARAKLQACLALCRRRGRDCVGFIFHKKERKRNNRRQES